MAAPIDRESPGWRPSIRRAGHGRGEQDAVVGAEDLRLRDEEDERRGAAAGDAGRLTVLGSQDAAVRADGRVGRVPEEEQPDVHAGGRLRAAGGAGGAEVDVAPELRTGLPRCEEQKQRDDRGARHGFRLPRSATRRAACRHDERALHGIERPPSSPAPRATRGRADAALWRPAPPGKRFPLDNAVWTNVSHSNTSSLIARRRSRHTRFGRASGAARTRTPPPPGRCRPPRERAASRPGDDHAPAGAGGDLSPRDVAVVARFGP